jgi:hypothetical protein
MALNVSNMLLEELTREPVPDAFESTRTLAFADPSCPVVSLLGTICLNKQPANEALMNTYGLEENVKQSLRNIHLSVMLGREPIGLKLYGQVGLLPNSESSLTEGFST